MGIREIDRNADASALGRGWFGIDAYLDPVNLEFAHFFGSRYPDNRMKDRWDYSLNDRHALPRVQGTVNENGTGDYMRNGYYDLKIAPSQLGVAFTMYALVFRNQGPNGANDGAYLGSFPSPFGVTLYGVHGAPGKYVAVATDGTGTNGVNVQLPMTSFTGTGWELLVAVIDGTGALQFYVRRPNGDNGFVAATGLQGNQVWGSKRMRAGLVFGGAFAYGDAISAVGGYSRAFTAADVDKLYAGLKSFFLRFGGPAL